MQKQRRVFVREFIRRASVKFANQETPVGGIAQSVFAGLALFRHAFNRTHWTRHNQSQRGQFTAPIFTRAGVKFLTRLAATQKRIAWKNPVNDFLCVLRVVLNARMRQFPQVRQPAIVSDDCFALFLIHTRPFRGGLHRRDIALWLPRARNGIFHGVLNLLPADVPPATLHPAFNLRPCHIPRPGRLC